MFSTLSADFRDFRQNLEESVESGRFVGESGGELLNEIADGAEPGDRAAKADGVAASSSLPSLSSVTSLFPSSISSTLSSAMSELAAEAKAIGPVASLWGPQSTARPSPDPLLVAATLGHVGPSAAKSPPASSRAAEREEVAARRAMDVGGSLEADGATYSADPEPGTPLVLSEAHAAWFAAHTLTGPLPLTLGYDAWRNRLAEDSDTLHALSTSLCSRRPVVEAMHAASVPDVVNNVDFWARFSYRRLCLAAQLLRRAELLAAATESELDDAGDGSEDGDGWGGDDSVSVSDSDSDSDSNEDPPASVSSGQVASRADKVQGNIAAEEVAGGWGDDDDSSDDAAPVTDRTSDDAVATGAPATPAAAVPTTGTPSAVQVSTPTAATAQPDADSDSDSDFGDWE